MDAMTCPKCSSEMLARRHGEVEVAQCSGCSGIFLESADLGELSEAENDWHQGVSSQTAAMPRISEDMVAPPPSKPRARSFLETLFG